MDDRERLVRRWFDMWLTGADTGIGEIFDADCVYIESWGPKYVGLEKVHHWFLEWNTRGRVKTWDITGFFHNKGSTAVLWYFEDEMKDGRVERFDGVSLIEWSKQGKISSLKEFGCRAEHYDPYGQGEQPLLKNTEMWTAGN